MVDRRANDRRTLHLSLSRDDYRAVGRYARASRWKPVEWLRYLVQAEIARREAAEPAQEPASEPDRELAGVR